MRDYTKDKFESKMLAEIVETAWNTTKGSKTVWLDMEQDLRVILSLEVPTDKEKLLAIDNIIAAYTGRG